MHGEGRNGVIASASSPLHGSVTSLRGDQSLSFVARLCLGLRTALHPLHHVQ